MVQVGERLRAEVTVVQQSGRKVVFKTVCERVSEAGERQVVVEGQALALLPIGSNNDLKVS
jgi:acyl dehydratase